MTRQVNRAENWEVAYKAFKAVNFTAYTFDAVKQSLIDYVRQYHSEMFSSFIESSELIAVIETFAYIVEQLSYRLDMLSHENALSVAQRKESILRLASHLSYTASRNLPARGVLKITSISTTEQIFDSMGTNLSNVAIRWNDPVSSAWRERFHLIVNRALAREFGNVSPTDRIQVGDVLYEQYQLNTINTPTTLPYSINIGGDTVNMELVSAILTSSGPEERRPYKGMPFAILFADDGNGDDSAMTGFFCMTKQGTLNRREFDLNGVPPNHAIRVDVSGINNTDVWLNRIDAAKSPYVNPTTNIPESEWDPIDTSTAYNVIFNTSDSKRLYEIETRDLDRIRLMFGDGEFADIPTGKFELWFRTSEYERDIVIPKLAISEQAFAFTYPDASGQIQTLRITVSSTSTIQNAARTEDPERIRRVAPSAYYAQDRMVSGRDYNAFPLKDNSILKLRSINRTFAGDSKYIPWHDATGSYEDVKMFGTNLTLHYDTGIATDLIDEVVTANGVIDNYLTPLLRSTDFVTRYALSQSITSRPPPSVFSDSERAQLLKMLREIKASAPGTFYGVLDSTVTPPVWQFTSQQPDERSAGESLWWFAVTANASGWTLRHATKKIVASSPTTKFWDVNTEKTVASSTSNAVTDKITILAANKAFDGSILTADLPLTISGMYTQKVGIERGLADLTSVYVLPADQTKDGIPDNLRLVPVLGTASSDDDYVYFALQSDGSWSPVTATAAVIRAYYEQFGWTFTINADGTRGTPQIDPGLTSVTGRKIVWKHGAAPNATIKREVGRTNLNFLWQHFTTRYHLVDPSPSNLIDMYVMTRGYQQAYDLWLSGRLPLKPQPPTTAELRTSYKPLLDNKMFSDTIIFQSGRIKTIISDKSDPSLRMRIKVIKSPSSLLTNSEIKVRVIEACREFFDINKWEFGSHFYATEAVTAIHNKLGDEIDSAVFVPASGDATFGDGFQILAREDEIIYGFVTPSDIEIITSLDRASLRQA